MAAVYLLKGKFSLFFTGRRYFNNRFWFVTRLSAFLTIDKEKIYISIVPLIRGSYSLKFFNIQYFLASDIWINGQIWLHVQYTNNIICTFEVRYWKHRLFYRLFLNLCRTRVKSHPVIGNFFHYTTLLNFSLRMISSLLCPSFCTCRRCYWGGITKIQILFFSWSNSRFHP